MFVILVKKEGAIQYLIYCIIQALREVEVRYPRVKILAFALVTTGRRLYPYFQTHTIKVLTETPLAKVLTKSDCTERLIEWSIKLKEFDLEYELRKAIKGQALADFVVEITRFPQKDPTVPMEKPWVLLVDGSSCWVGRGLRMHLTSPHGREHYYIGTLIFKVMNNETEYETLVAGLSVTQQMGAAELEVKADTKVVLN